MGGLNGPEPKHNPNCAFCCWSLGLPPKKKGMGVYDLSGENGGLSQ